MSEAEGLFGKAGFFYLYVLVPSKPMICFLARSTSWPCHALSQENRSSSTHFSLSGFLTPPPFLPILFCSVSLLVNEVSIDITDNLLNGKCESSWLNSLDADPNRVGVLGYPEKNMTRQHSPL